jgi:hypothetical protein
VRGVVCGAVIAWEMRHQEMLVSRGGGVRGLSSTLTVETYEAVAGHIVTFTNSEGEDGGACAHSTATRCSCCALCTEEPRPARVWTCSSSTTHHATSAPATPWHVLTSSAEPAIHPPTPTATSSTEQIERSLTLSGRCVSLAPGHFLRSEAPAGARTSPDSFPFLVVSSQHERRIQLF